MPESDVPSETDPKSAAERADEAAEAGPEKAAKQGAPANADSTDAGDDAEPAPPMNRAARRGNTKGGRQPMPRHVGPMSGRGLAAPGKQNYANRKSG